MSDDAEQEKSSRTGLYVMLGVAGCLLLYVLSFGPVFVMVESGIITRGSDFYRAAEFFYMPISWVSNHYKPAEEFMIAYINFCLWLAGRPPFEFHF